MKFRRAIFIIAVVTLFFSCTKKQNTTDNNSRLWYRYPAKYWNSQALHLGNGFFGASFFGGIDEEVFAISEKSMWTGGPAEGRWEKAGVNPGARGSLPIIRKAILDGKYQLADSLVAKNVFGSSELFGNFTSVGNLVIRFLHQDNQSGQYLRELDLSSSIGSVQYEINKIRFRREYFCSYPDRVLAMRFSSGTPGGISFDLKMDIIQDSSTLYISGNRYEVKGYIDDNLRPFNVLMQVKNHGGSVSREGEYLTLRNSDSAEIYLAVATNYEMRYPDYTGSDPSVTTEDIIKNAINSGFEVLRKRHMDDYKSLYDRVTFSITGNAEAEKLPTNERFERLKSGGQDIGYKTLAFNLGRYMIISSSRPNTLPANLQGVWNAFKAAPWAGNYQSNINLQEIYWSCGPTALTECQQAYIDWIEDLSESGKEIAKRVYGTNGWVSHTTGNIWGHAAPVGGHPWGMFPMGAAWHCQHLWEQFAFTRDTQYLKKQAYPLLKGASVFWLENLVPLNGYFITAPTVSAEHGALMTTEGLNPAFHDSVSTRYNYCLTGVYQDIEMLWDLFTNTAAAAEIAGEKLFADSLLKVRQKLIPLKIGKHGQLQEWYDDIDDPDCHHRHIAHLYAVCPGREINPVITPDLAEAAKISLNMRGDGRFPEQESVSGGNWARAHRMWCWTRLFDGNRAIKIMNELLTDQGFENGLTFQHIGYHWGRQDFYSEGDLFCHFQLDASASLPGCIAEMLLQSHMGELYLLPALPGEFKSGKVTGLRARGGYTVNLEWDKNELIKAEILAGKGIPVPVVRYRNNLIDLTDSKAIEFKRADI